MKPKVLITDPVDDLLIAGLQVLGFEVDYWPDTNEDVVLAVIQDYTGLIINSKIRAGVQLIDAGERLQFIGRLGSGLDVIDQPYAEQKGVAYFNTPDGNCDAVAEHALGMLLCLMNNINRAYGQVKQGLWSREPNRGAELGEKTVAIIGYGHTGAAFAKKLAGFDVTVLAYDKYKSGFAKGHIKEATWDEIFEEADVVSFHTQLTDETRYMVNAGMLKRFRKPVYLINTSRGPVVQTTALLEAINTGKVMGAALDVLENEKPDTFNREEQAVFDRLLNEERVLVTPHIAGWTRESKIKIAESVLRKVRDLRVV